jgi:hypothetical protein
MAATIKIGVNNQQAAIAINEAQSRIDKRLSEVLNDILDAAEQVQIKKYTQDANPAKPAGSPYIRTFKLRESSYRIRTGKFSAELATDPDIAPYARFVVGPQALQAPIHRGRWKSTEEVIREVRKIAPKIINEAFK